jgi:hypothetical protein
MRYGFLISWVTSYEQYTVLRAANFDAKTFELWVLHRLFVELYCLYWSRKWYTASVNVSDNLQSSKIVVRLVEPHVNQGYTLWMDGYHATANSSCNFFSHFFKLKIKLCFKFEVFLPILQMSWKHCSWRASDLMKRVKFYGQWNVFSCKNVFSENTM